MDIFCTLPRFLHFRYRDPAGTILMNMKIRKNNDKHIFYLIYKCMEDI